MTTANRLRDTIRFYTILNRLEETCGGRRLLSTSTGKTGWPQRGVYFFMEDGENRSGSGTGSRLVRIGTHALKTGSGTSLWNRLSQHRGQEKSGGGNHRGSIFRLIVGTALDTEKRYTTWGQGSTAPRDVRAAEIDLETDVSRIIGAMPFLWLSINDDASPESLRGYIERNSIALLSMAGKEPVDPPSSHWLGHRCARERVRLSGLWNQNHVDEDYNPAFLDVFDRLVAEMGAS